MAASLVPQLAVAALVLVMVAVAHVGRRALPRGLAASLGPGRAQALAVALLAAAFALLVVVARSLSRAYSE